MSSNRKLAKGIGNIAMAESFSCIASFCTGVSILKGVNLPQGPIMVCFFLGIIAYLFTIIFTLLGLRCVKKENIIFRLAQYMFAFTTFILFVYFVFAISAGLYNEVEIYSSTASHLKISSSILYSIFCAIILSGCAKTLQERNEKEKMKQTKVAEYLFLYLSIIPSITFFVIEIANFSFAQPNIFFVVMIFISLMYVAAYIYSIIALYRTKKEV